MPTVAESLAMRISIIVMITDGLQPLILTCLADTTLVDLAFDQHAMELVSTPIEFSVTCLRLLGAKCCLVLVLVIRPPVVLKSVK